ncbi:DUF2336 domain-containing protein [Methylocapsa sp. S129]|uniref:DUF2336 domain-containing protein n=1 Tax=Methylocapsa sp. S129 TaxID=1641869 RepID=UPI00131A7260|nr:DUF2336 domain-containing protein [Methylocapsa sp. S129]
MLHQESTSLPFLASLRTADNAESRRILLRITTDHFISRQDHSIQQLAQFEKTMLRLIARADPFTRLIVARKLACHPMAPPRALEMLEEMGGEGALHLLECAPLSRDRLVAAASGNESRACALARRVDLDAELVATLSLRPEPGIALALAANAAAPLDAQACAALARRAERERPLADALLSRPPGGIDAASLFLLASSEQRAAILAAAQRAELARASVARQEPDRDEALARLERHALARQPELFINVLAQALGCSRDLAERIAREPSGEPLAVAVKALDAPQDSVVRILISGDYVRIGSLIRLTDGLNPAAARRVIGALTGAREERGAHYQPVLDPHAHPSPSRVASGSSAPVANVSANAARRQRAFAFALAQSRVQKSG